MPIITNQQVIKAFKVVIKSTNILLFDGRTRARIHCCSPLAPINHYLAPSSGQWRANIWLNSASAHLSASNQLARHLGGPGPGPLWATHSASLTNPATLSVSLQFLLFFSFFLFLFSFRAPFCLVLVTCQFGSFCSLIRKSKQIINFHKLYAQPTTSPLPVTHRLWRLLQLHSHPCYRLRCAFCFQFSVLSVFSHVLCALSLSLIAFVSIAAFPVVIHTVVHFTFH